MRSCARTHSSTRGWTSLTAVQSSSKMTTRLVTYPSAEMTFFGGFLASQSRDRGSSHDLLPMQVEGGKRLKKNLMPDSLHPDSEGMEELAGCLRPLLAKYGVKTMESVRKLLSA